MKKIMINGKTLTELREEIKLPRIKGWLYCPGGDDGPCKMNYRNRNGAGMSAHRGAVHDYVSPLSDFYKEAEEKRTRGKVKESRNGALPAFTVSESTTGAKVTLDPAYYNSTKKSLVQQPNGGYHCPVNNCKFKHTHARWTNQHVFDEHGIELRKSKSHKPRRAWGSNRIAAAAAAPHVDSSTWMAHRPLSPQQSEQLANKIDEVFKTPEVVFTGVDRCPDCGTHLEPYHRLKLAMLRAKQSGGTYKVTINVKGERHA